MTCTPQAVRIARTIVANPDDDFKWFSRLPSARPFRLACPFYSAADAEGGGHHLSAYLQLGFYSRDTYAFCSRSAHALGRQAHTIQVAVRVDHARARWSSCRSFADAWTR